MKIYRGIDQKIYVSDFLKSDIPEVFKSGSFNAINGKTKVLYTNICFNYQTNSVDFKVNDIDQIWMGIDYFMESVYFIEN